MTDDRQTLLGVIGIMLFAIAAYMAVSVLVFDATPSGQWAIERTLSGSWMAINLITIRYHRLPVERRLPPAHAIGLGGFQLVQLSWLILSAPKLAGHPWLVVMGLGLIAIPGVYLIATGVRAVRGAGASARQ